MAREVKFPGTRNVTEELLVGGDSKPKYLYSGNIYYDAFQRCRWYLGRRMRITGSDVDEAGVALVCWIPAALLVR